MKQNNLEFINSLIYFFLSLAFMTLRAELYTTFSHINLGQRHHHHYLLYIIIVSIDVVEFISNRKLFVQFNLIEYSIGKRFNAYHTTSQTAQQAWFQFK